MHGTLQKVVCCTSPLTRKLQLWFFTTKSMTARQSQGNFIFLAFPDSIDDKTSHHFKAFKHSIAFLLRPNIAK
jgi:hypothetical protein